MPTPVERNPAENLVSACAKVLKPLHVLIYEFSRLNIIHKCNKHLHPSDLHT